MNNTNARTNEANTGLPGTKPNDVPQPALPALKPWDIAKLPLYRSSSGQVLNVEQATDAQFEAWRIENGIPVKENGIVEWSFEMRCRAINHCRLYGAWDELKFPLEENGAPNPDESIVAIEGKEE